MVGGVSSANDIVQLKILGCQFLPQIVSGKLRQATSVLLHLTGAAAGFADLLRGSGRSTGGAGKVRMLCGVQSSDKR